MRLIDADDLILTILTNDLCDDDNVDKAILNAPTVKAIPVEYIEKFKKEFRAVASVKAVIEWLLEKWEKENEIDRR